MTETFDPLGSMKSFFFANDKSLPASTRQKIALAMMMQKRAHPKTFGEGLSAIGDSLGDIGTMRRLEREAASSEEAGKAVESKILGGDGAASLAPQRTSYAPETDVPMEQELTPPIAAAQPNLRPTVTPPPQPAPGNLPPTGEPGNTGATTFPPPFQPPPGSLPMQAPPPAQAAPPPRSWPTPGPIAAPQPYSSGAPTGAPPPPVPLPEQPPAQNFNDRFSPAGTGRRSEAPPEALVGGAGTDQLVPPANARDAIAAALVSQAGGGPQPNPTMPAGGGPPPSALPLAGADPSQGVKPAPRPQQLAQAASPEPGYVLELPPEKPPPPTMTLRMQQIQQAVRQAAPGDREAITERLKPLYDAETTKVTRAHEEYKDYRNQRQALELKQHEQRAAARASVDAARAAATAEEKAREDIRRARDPVLHKDVEGQHIFNPATGQYEEPKIAGADPSKKPIFKGTEFQGKALVNYGRARLAQEGLKGENETILAESPLQSAISSLPYGAGRGWRSEAYKQADDYAENFVQAFIRQQSGGAYTPVELETEARAMLPKYGDTADQIAAKREQREQFLNGLYSIIGPSGQKGVEIDAARREADRAARPPSGAKSTSKYQEGQEAVWPDKSIRVYRDGKWVPK